MTTYPTTPTVLTIQSAFAGSILRNYREAGFVQATAVVRDTNRVEQTMNVDRRFRKLDLKTCKTLSVAGVQTALVTTDVLQVMPVAAEVDSAGLVQAELIVGGALRVLRVASAGATATITVQVGATAISAAINILALGVTVINTALPLVVTAADTIDFVLTGTTSPVFDALVELEMYIQPSRG
jgi:hypothetical protein